MRYQNILYMYDTSHAHNMTLSSLSRISTNNVSGFISINITLSYHKWLMVQDSQRSLSRSFIILNCGISRMKSRLLCTFFVPFSLVPTSISRYTDFNFSMLAPLLLTGRNNV